VIPAIVPPSVDLARLRWWDLDEVLPIEAELFGPDAWTAGQFWSELARMPETRWYVLARLAGRVVGYAGLFQAGAEADVQTVAVARSAQGRGIGRLLVEALVAAARSRGADVLHLEVRADNADARALYDRLGFEVVGRRPDYYGRGRDAVLMTRRLRAAPATLEEVPRG
jgi:ribosomal-protein-alanine N-acetyltransferase